jgi:hypothetical protein
LDLLDACGDECFDDGDLSLNRNGSVERLEAVAESYLIDLGTAG